MTTATRGKQQGSAVRPPRGQTAARILDVAEGLVQERGFNAFSYADIAGELSISKASVHHHFAGKAELGEALISRYAQRFAAALEQITASERDAPAKLGAYTRLYADVLRSRRMCLCGMLAAEYEALPGSMADAIVAFFDANERWLAEVLEGGRTDGTLTFAGSSEEMAQVLIGGLEGAMLVARPYHDFDRFRATTAGMLRNLLDAEVPT